MKMILVSQGYLSEATSLKVSFTDLVEIAL